MIILCTDYTSTYTWLRVLKVDQGKNRERSNEALSQTLVLTKKAKIATPVKTGKVISHTSTHCFVLYN